MVQCSQKSAGHARHCCYGGDDTFPFLAALGVRILSYRHGKYRYGIFLRTFCFGSSELNEMAAGVAFLATNKQRLLAYELYAYLRT